MNTIVKNNIHTLNKYKVYNPNLINLKFDSQGLLHSSDKTIDLKRLLLSDFLNNITFRGSLNIITEEEFLNIIEIHLEAMDIMDKYQNNKTNNTKNIDENEYVIDIKKNENYLKIITNKKTYKLSKKMDELLEAYEKNNSNFYISLQDLLIKANIINDNINNNLHYFNLLKKVKLTDPEFKEKTDFEKFVIKLLYNQDYLIGDASNIFNDYKNQITSLYLSEQKNSLEKNAVEFYKKICNKYMEELKEKYEEQIKKEEKSSSLGYSSLVLILTSTLITSLFITFLTLYVTK